ncbi:hypothetical protein RirG_191030 [Rhizophagus irregularis DAOM 197198w]|uniref:TLDc domain-containing protein n=1 Tax=Rhizophagus irregularis (strain DAOM 197198w) TaxID=1432141 RepID=A0A015JVU8_RHIIW|nr:hypothetical protein RirG_191030 [Rhizophagus irregularis DAOM 197198w]
MEYTLEHCLPLVRFFSLSSKEFSQKVRPYQKLFSRQLYEEIVDSFMDPDSKPNANILLPRNIKIEKIIDSKIVTNLSIVKTILRQIDKMNIRNNFAHLKESYKFKLLLRGSRDGFTPKKFHELCDGKSNTVILIKIEGTEEIVGGYNPLIWKSSGLWVET